MKVYRLETKGEHGPFSGLDWMTPKELDTLCEILGSFQTTETDPYPEDDGINDTQPDDVFGCVSLRQLYSWFPHPLRYKLATLGYRIVMYEVDKVKLGGKQCAFKKV